MIYASRSAPCRADLNDFNDFDSCSWIGVRKAFLARAIMPRRLWHQRHFRAPLRPSSGAAHSGSFTAVFTGSCAWCAGVRVCSGARVPAIITVLPYGCTVRQHILNSTSLIQSFPLFSRVCNGPPMHPWLKRLFMFFPIRPGLGFSTLMLTSTFLF